MDMRDGAADLGVLERSKPAPPHGRIALHPGPDCLDHEDVTEARDHCLAAGPELGGLGGHQPQRALHPLQPERAGSLDVDRARQDLDEVMPGAAEALGLFAELAVESGVPRLVLLSGRGEQEAERGERAVRDSGA
jgi:hypothetical protein